MIIFFSLFFTAYKRKTFNFRKRNEELNKINLKLSTEILDKQRAQKALKDSEKRYRNFIAHSSEGIYHVEMEIPVPIDLPKEEMIEEINKQGVIKEVNEALAGMYGLKPEDMIGKKAVDFTPEHGKGVILILGNNDYQVTNVETVDIDKDGVPISLSESFHGEIIGNKLVRIWGIQRNITEHKEAEEEKAKLEKQMRRSQKLETIGTLAGGITHDFNNVLSPIMGYTEMALLSLKKTDPLYKDLNHVLTGANRAKDLVEQILLFSKRSEKEWQPLSLQKLVIETLKLLRPSIPTTVEIRERIDDLTDKVRADSTQIHQVISLYMY